MKNGKGSLSSMGFIVFIMILSLAFCAVSYGSANADSKGAGMVLESGGSVKVITDKSEKKARMMQPLFAGSRIVTGKDGFAVFVSYVDNVEYRVEPGSDITIEANGFKTNSGAIKKKSGGGGIPLPKNTVLVSRRIMGQVHRAQKTGMSVVNPPANMVLASDKIKFQWTYGASHYYRLGIVEKDADKFVKPFPVSVNGNSYEYKNTPGNEFQLEYGKAYIFKVKEKEEEDELEDDSTWNATANFTMLPEDKAKAVTAAEKEFDKTTDGGKKADQRSYLLMADLYKENGMYYQAIDLLKKLENMDNTNPYIYYYMAEMYDNLGQKTSAQEMMEKGKERDTEGK